MLKSLTALLVLASTMVVGQRGSFAGSRPIGFPELANRTTTPPYDLADRFGEGTTQRLPLEANGDRDLVDRLSKLPIDKQPFWLINWQALEANRDNPQTYPQRPSGFADPIPQSKPAGFSGNNQGFSNNNQGFSNNNQGFSNNNQGFTNNNQGLSNNNQGFTNNNLGLPTHNQGLLNNNQGIPNNNQGLANNNQGLANNNNQGFSNNNQGFVNNHGFPNNNQGLSNNNNQGFPNNNQGLSNNNQGVSNNNQGLTNNDQGFFNNNHGLSNQGFSNAGSSSNQAPSNTNNNVGPQDNFELANKFGSGFINSINGIPITDPALSSNPVILNSSSKVPNSNIGPFNAETTTQTYYNTNQVYTDPGQPTQTVQQFITNQGFVPPNRGFQPLGPVGGFENQNRAPLIPNKGIHTQQSQNQGFVTSNHAAPIGNNGFTSTSTNTGFSNKHLVVSNSTPDINSRFSTSNSATATSSATTNRVGGADHFHYNYKWNNSYAHMHNYTYHYTTKPVFYVVPNVSSHRTQ